MKKNVRYVSGNNGYYYIDPNDPENINKVVHEAFSKGETLYYDMLDALDKVSIVLSQNIRENFAPEIDPLFTFFDNPQYGAPLVSTIGVFWQSKDSCKADMDNAHYDLCTVPWRNREKDFVVYNSGTLQPYTASQHVYFDYKSGALEKSINNELKSLETKLKSMFTSFCNKAALQTKNAKADSNKHLEKFKRDMAEVDDIFKNAPFNVEKFYEGNQLLNSLVPKSSKELQDQIQKFASEVWDMYNLKSPKDLLCNFVLKGQSLSVYSSDYSKFLDKIQNFKTKDIYKDPNKFFTTFRNNVLKEHPDFSFGSFEKNLEIKQIDNKVDQKDIKKSETKIKNKQPSKENEIINKQQAEISNFKAKVKDISTELKGYLSKYLENHPECDDILLGHIKGGLDTLDQIC